jgi:hypothetical protein
MCEAEKELKYLPAVQGVGESLEEGHQFPGGQGIHELISEEPTTLENTPGGQETHVLMVLEPIVVEYRPAGHFDGMLMPKLGQYVPAGHALQAELVDCRSEDEYVPGEQAAGRIVAAAQ